MTYVITEPCIDVKDQSCVEVCPVDCIHADEEDRILFISPDECIDCGACEPACPVTAIFAEDDVPAEWSGYTEVNAIWFEDKAGARGEGGGAGSLVPSQALAKKARRVAPGFLMIRAVAAGASDPRRRGWGRRCRLGPPALKPAVTSARRQEADG